MLEVISYNQADVNKLGEKGLGGSQTSQLTAHPDQLKVALGNLPKLD
jgi:hypothetical protein